MRRLAALALSAALGAAAFGSHADVASATVLPEKGIRTACVGTRLTTLTIRGRRTGAVLGRLELWYSSTRNGQNCVMTYDANGNASAYMEARLTVDFNDNKRADLPTERMSDTGTYSTYAGGAYINGTNGSCVSIYGSVKTANDSGDAYWGENGWRYCG